MKILIKDAADFVGGTVYGDENSYFESLGKIEEAKPGDLTFLYSASYEKFFPNTKATAIIVAKGFNKTRDDIIYIETENPNTAFNLILNKYFKPGRRLNGIDPSASISSDAVIGKNVAIGKNVVVSAGCSIGNDTVIYHNTVLLETVSVGCDTLIYPNVTIRENCVIGSRVIIHSGTVIGADGFGYLRDSSGRYNKIPQIGNVVLEDDVELGANVTVDRAALGSTVIKKGAKIDNLVQIAHNVSVGENTVMSAQVGIAGSTKIGNNCILAGQAGIVGHIELGDNIIITAQSGVSKNLNKPGMYFGSPVKEHKTGLKIEAHLRSLPAYAEKIKKLETELDEIKKLMK
jgi:UDP-3-O-[3-hydroxymyristoyl] glucosamine N-acyltransferase